MFYLLHGRLFLTGLYIWVGATIVLRFVGQYLLRSGGWTAILILFAISFVAMALLARNLCRGAHLSREDWPRGAISLVLPTLLLDPFSSAFFPVIFPNMAAGMAGVFGGWMLVCCAGALAGVIVDHKSTA
jgi:hypothetical protein